MRELFARRYDTYKQEHTARRALVAARADAIAALARWEQLEDELETHRRDADRHAHELWWAAGLVEYGPHRYDDGPPAPPTDSQVEEAEQRKSFQNSIDHLRKVASRFVAVPTLSAGQEFIAEAEGWLDDRSLASILYGDDFNEADLKSLQVTLTGLRKTQRAWAAGVDAETFYGQRDEKRSARQAERSDLGDAGDPEGENGADVVGSGG